MIEEKCEICLGSGKRTDPIDGTVWPDDPCPACRFYPFKPGSRVRHLVFDDLGVGVVMEPEPHYDEEIRNEVFPEGTHVTWLNGGAGFYSPFALVEIPFPKTSKPEADWSKHLGEKVVVEAHAETSLFIGTIAHAGPVALAFSPGNPGQLRAWRTLGDERDETCMHQEFWTLAEKKKETLDP